MLVLKCEPFLLTYVAAKQIARAAGSYGRAARQPARAVRPATRVAGPAALAAVAGLSALSAVAGAAAHDAVAGLAALAAVAGLATHAALRAAPPPPTQTHTHQVRNLAVCHLAVPHPHSSNAIWPQPVLKHEDKEWPRADNTHPRPGFRLIAGVVKHRRGRRHLETTPANHPALPHAHDKMVPGPRVQTLSPPLSETRTRVPAFAPSPG